MIRTRRSDRPGPGALVVGVGSRGGVAVAEVVTLVEATLRDAGLSLRHVVELATVEARAAEPGIVAAASRLGVPLRAYPAELLAGIVVPNPSDAPLGAVGTPSVAEAAALAGGGELLVSKRTSGRDGRPAAATCAVARRTGSGPDLPSADSVVVAAPPDNGGPTGNSGPRSAGRDLPAGGENR